MNKNKNMVMSAAAAAVLVAVNVGVFMAAGKGAIAPIDSMPLWGAFVALNIAAILWAVNMLGLQPLVVSLSYVAGGVLAFQGVRGMTGVSVAEVTTAGATYGAFGALAIGNATTKVRLAFFNKGQVPFIFILLGLLVVDAVLNSQVSKAGGNVLLNAVVFPFALAGVVLGLVWSMLNRFGIGKKPSEVLAEMDAYAEMAKEEQVDAVAAEPIVIPMPETAVEEHVEPEPAKPIEIVEPIAPAAKAPPVVDPQPVVADVEPEKEEAFFPLDIDKGEEVAPTEEPNLLDVMAALENETEKEDEFGLPSFDESLYASGSMDNDVGGNVLVKEPEVVVEIEPEPVRVPEPVATPEPLVAEVEPEPVRAPEPAKEESGSDFLSGHLDLLNKLK